MSNIVNFPGATTVPVPAKTILDAALAADLKIVLVVGADQDGNLWTSSNRSETAELNLCLDFAKRKLLEFST